MDAQNINMSLLISFGVVSNFGLNSLVNSRATTLPFSKSIFVDAFASTLFRSVAFFLSRLFLLFLLNGFSVSVSCCVYRAGK